MEPSDDIRQLLKDIRDTQREHLAEYRKVAERSLQLQERAIGRQEKIGGLYQRMLLIGGVLFVALLMLLVYVLIRWSEPLFGI